MRRFIPLAARVALLVLLVWVGYGAWDPHHNAKASVPPADVVEHIGYAYLLTLLTVAALPKVSPWVIGGVFLAGSIGFEILQAMGVVAGTMQWKDLISNPVGIAAALAPMALAKRARG